MKVNKTKDYSIFIYLPENRSIANGHVKNLMDSIEKQNLLHVNPIIVDANMFVIDGQHRLEAAKGLEIDVYYTILEEDCDHESLYLLQQSKPWSLKEFVEFYIKIDPDSSYVQFKIDCEKYNLAYDTLCYLYSMFSFKKKRAGLFLIRSRIKNGTFSFSSVDLALLHESLTHYVKFRSFCEERVIRPKSIFKGTNNVLGFCCFYGFYKPNMKRFMTLLSDRWFTLSPGRSYRESVNGLTKIYNYKRKEGTLTFNDFESASFKPSFCLGRSKEQMSLDI